MIGNMRFNIDMNNTELMNSFSNELKNVKNLMESDKDINFYLNVRFSKNEMESLDLSRFATIKIFQDGFACYSLKTQSSSFIFFKDIIGLELVEIPLELCGD